MKKKVNFKLIILIAIISLIGIGYAALTAQLNIKGSFYFDKVKWNIHFDNVEMVEGSVEGDLPKINSEKTQITYSATLKQSYDYYAFDVDLTNDGTLYAVIDNFSIVYGDEKAEDDKYVEVVVTYIDGTEVKKGDMLLPGQSEVLTISTEYKPLESFEDIPTEERDLDVTFSIVYRQATKSEKNSANLKEDSEYNKFAKVIDQKVSGTISTNDVVSIGNEKFYVLSHNTSDTTLIAKYNLNVGNKIDKEVEETYQSEMTKDNYGNVAFSNIEYWMEDGKLKEDYKKSLLDFNYVEKSGDNYSVLYYLNRYGRVLKRAGAKNITVRLPRTDDILIKSVPEIEKYSFWMEDTTNGLLNYYKNGSITSTKLEDAQSVGVRPIIVVKTRNIKNT